jgi:hypothetical protein
VEGQKQSLVKSTLIGKFSTQEAAQEVNRLLHDEGLCSAQSTVDTVEAEVQSSLSQVKSESNAVRAAIAGGLCGGVIGLIACLIQVRVSDSSFLSSEPGLITAAVSLAAGLVGALASSIVGVISASGIPTQPLSSSPKVPSHGYLVEVEGDSTALEKAAEIIKASGGQV